MKKIVYCDIQNLGNGLIHIWFRFDNYSVRTMTLWIHTEVDASEFIGLTEAKAEELLRERF